MDPEKIKEFSDAVNNKMRKVQLNLAKIELENKKYNNEKENQKKMYYSYNKNKKINILLDNDTKKRDFNISRISQKKNNIREKFDKYRFDFALKYNDLKIMLNNKISSKYTILNEDKINEKKYLLTSNNLLNRKQSPNIHILPKITKDKRETFHQENKNHLDDSDETKEKLKYKSIQTNK